MTPFLQQWQNHRIPALRGAFLYALGLCIAHFANLPLPIARSQGLALATLVVALVVIAGSSKNKTLLYLLIVVGFVRGTTHREAFWQKQQILPNHAIRGTISFRGPPRYHSKGESFQEVSLSIKAPSLPSPRMVVATTLPNALLPGESRTIQGLLTPGTPSHVPWQPFPSASYRKQLVGVLHIDSVHTSTTNTTTALYRSILRTITPLTKNSQSLIKATLLGERFQLTPRVSATLQEAGMSHFLAISGLHVTLLATLAGSMLHFLPLSLWWRRTILAGIIWCLILLTGASSSTLRALIMVSIFLGATTLRTKSCSLNTLGAALIIYLYIAPHQLHSIGLQFSAAATGAIIAILPLVSTLPRLVRLGLSPLLISTTAALATLPLQLYHFGTTTPLGWFANTLFLPPLVLLYQTLVTTVLLPIPLLHRLLLPLLDYLLNSLLYLIELLLLATSSGIVASSDNFLWLSLFPLGFVGMLIITHPTRLFIKSGYLILTIFTLLLGSKISQLNTTTLLFFSEGKEFLLLVKKGRQQQLITHTPPNTTKAHNHQINRYILKERLPHIELNSPRSLLHTPSKTSPHNLVSLTAYYHNQGVDSILVKTSRDSLSFDLSQKVLRPHPKDAPKVYLPQTHYFLSKRWHNHSLKLRRSIWK